MPARPIHTSQDERPRQEENLRSGARLQEIFCPAACHEIYAARESEAISATAFALITACQSARSRPIIWIRHDFLDREFGAPFPFGVSELGFDPRILTLVRTPNSLAALQAGLESARCGALGAVIIELWGPSKSFDNVASRRLTLAAQSSGATILITRAGAETQPSTAMSRWQIETASSRPLAANAPGPPAFVLRLLRHRNGTASGDWHLEWNRDRQCFEEAIRIASASKQRDRGAALSGAVVPLSFSR